MKTLLTCALLSIAALASPAQAATGEDLKDKYSMEVITSRIASHLEGAQTSLESYAFSPAWTTVDRFYGAGAHILVGMKVKVNWYKFKFIVRKSNKNYLLVCWLGDELNQGNLANFDYDYAPINPCTLMNTDESEISDADLRHDFGTTSPTVPMNLSIRARGLHRPRT